MPQHNKDQNKGKPLPMKKIVFTIAILFFILVVGFMIMPAYFDKNPFGKLFHNEPAPWALSQEEQKKMNLTDSQVKGRYHYLQYCASCHGPLGKGDGPSSVTLRKRPPDFFHPASKFINGFKEQSLLKTLNEGIPNSEMPSFLYLPPENKNQIVDFLIYMKKNQGYY
ncbi:c-type cytochrome [Silvanigrella aquatica]|uniref:Cytochrome c domain-containing protein n=1 Tax=Silvanigrella aquatica TaxID=1915309 RepID=A0A1L4CXH2_9BACT|nr:cytochrome c [Silvanigrella aquatica]APJ02644.1 hypothetical protein AXG55_01330 [Silvanigrella aquatica]